MRERYSCPQCSAEYLLDTTLDKVIKCPKCSFKGILTDYVHIQVKDLYCIHCGANIKLKTGRDVKTITCPKCNRTELVSKFSETPIKILNKEESDLEETFVGTQIKKSVKGTVRLLRPAKLVLYKDIDNAWQTSSVIEFPLKRGENTIGRKSSKSISSIQLPTSDGYMSKNHLIIDVIMKSDSTFEHRLSDNGSVNGTFHNGQRIENGDVIILSTGDVIRLGHTELILKVE